MPGLTELALTAVLQSPPRIHRCEPATVSADSILQLEGTLRSADEREYARITMRRDGVTLLARGAGGAFAPSAPDRLNVAIPKVVTPGSWEVVAEMDGQTSEPCTVQVTDWSPPALEEASPDVIGPGERLAVVGMNFHAEDVFVLEDSSGRVRTIEAGGFCCAMDYRPLYVPSDIATGRAQVRIGAVRDGVKRLSNPVEFTVTNEPLTFELEPSEMAPVARGQWVEMAVSARSYPRRERSDRIEVEFAQGDRIFVVDTAGPQSLRVRVPETLTAGSVTLRVRRWSERRVSAWSERVTYRILERPAPPVVDWMGVESAEKQGIRFDRDRAVEFSAHAGDVLLLHGLFPVGSCRQLQITIDGSAGRVQVPCEFQADHRVRFMLPPTLPSGFWRLAVTATGAGGPLRHDVPIAIRVE